MAAIKQNKYDKIDLGIIRKKDKNNPKKEEAVLDNNQNSTKTNEEIDAPNSANSNINEDKESQPDCSLVIKPKETSKRQILSIVSDYGISSNSESD